jgi:hypothetical protein
MRWMVLTLIGCGGAASHPEACDRLVMCATITNPFLVEEYRAAYDPEGTCWSTWPAADCEAQCIQIMTELYVQFDEERCDPVPLTGVPLLTEDEFFEAYRELECEAQDRCGSGQCQDEPGTCGVRDFDPLKGEECLAEGFNCNYGWPYPAEACGQVCE